MGPTASGKTDLAVSLYKSIPSEIISVDSAMIYRGMDIGTAKPSSTILKTAPHHLIDIRDPTESYSVAEFCDDAGQLIDDIQARNRLPILVGGTIMYFHSLQFGLSEMPTADAEIRQQLDQFIDQHGLEALHKRLAKVDPESAARIHPNDAQRIQRALEVYQLTGVKLSSWHDVNVPTRSHLAILPIGLFPQDRTLLHQQIAMRFKQMLQDGVIDELKALREQWTLNAELPAMRCIGYRQIWSYLEGQTSHQQMSDQAIAATRQLAKRQLSWLRHYPDIQRIDPNTCTTTDITEQIICQLQRTNW